MTDLVNHPPHYTEHPSGVECIQITEHFNFNLGNAIKYIWRADSKGDQFGDLEKAAWYIQREIERLATEVDTVIEGLEDLHLAEYPVLDDATVDQIRASVVPVEDLRFDSPTPLSDSINRGVRARA